MSEAAIDDGEALEDQHLPKPVGYQLLVALPDVEETFGESGLVKADETKRNEQILSVVGVVVDVGEDAYQDKERFPRGPWCKQGDFIVFRANTGTRISVFGKEFRLMNDDSVQAVVDDPRGIVKA